MKLGEVVDILSGYAFKSSLFNQENLGMPIIRIRDIKNSFSNTYYSGDYLEDYVINSGDYLIGLDGEFNIYEWKGTDALLNQRVCKITAKEDKLSPRYLLRVLPKELKRIEDKTSFATVKHLSVKKIKDIDIPLPPLPIQERIAEILDAADALRQKDRQLLEKYEQLSQSIFLHMFGDPLVKKGEYSTIALDDVCDKITDGEHGTVKRLTEGRPYLMARNVQDEKLDLTEISYISEVDHKKIYKRCNPEKDDLLLVCVGATIGRVCLVPNENEFSLARSVALIKPNKKRIDPVFLLNCFKSRYLQIQMKNMSNTSAQAGLYTGQIKKIQIMLPPIELQNGYSEKVKNIELQKNKINDGLIKSESLFQSLLQKAFKGELVPEDQLKPA